MGTTPLRASKPPLHDRAVALGGITGGTGGQEVPDGVPSAPRHGDDVVHRERGLAAAIAAGEVVPGAQSAPVPFGNHEDPGARQRRPAPPLGSLAHCRIGLRVCECVRQAALTLSQVPFRIIPAAAIFRSHGFARSAAVDRAGTLPRHRLPTSRAGGRQLPKSLVAVPHPSPTGVRAILRPTIQLADLRTAPEAYAIREVCRSAPTIPSLPFAPSRAVFPTRPGRLAAANWACSIAHVRLSSSRTMPPAACQRCGGPVLILLRGGGRQGREHAVPLAR
jgi:hypothetical protein